MVNPFLSSTRYDTETAIMLEQCLVDDIGNAVAFTDGKRIFLNTQDNLFKILPHYNDDMLKWLLWHERMHLELRHHNRYFKYLDDLDEDDTLDEFKVTKNDVNIIMDILVHDWMAKKFPELVETAKSNLAQFRNSNSLKYTFTTYTLEEMLDEYAKHKRGDDGEDTTDGEDTDGEGEGIGDESSSTDKTDGTDSTDSKPKKKPHKSKSTTKGHEEGSDSTTPDTGTSEHEDAPDDSEKKPGRGKTEPDEHDKDWSKLEDIDDKEFITEREGDNIKEHIDGLQRKIKRLTMITKTLNGLVTSTKTRTYKTPSYTMTGQHTIFKGQQKSKAALYLVFDASGSMSGEMDLFKDIISKAVPQAMNTTTEWFSGYGARIPRNPEGRNRDYYKGTFKDFLPVRAMEGYNNDGDRTIELCLAAEKQGYSPIGVTDGGGAIYEPEVLKQLKRTVLVGSGKYWLEKAKQINPNIQTLWVEF